MKKALFPILVLLGIVLLSCSNLTEPNTIIDNSEPEIVIDEGTSLPQDISIEDLKQMCEEQGIKLLHVSNLNSPLPLDKLQDVRYCVYGTVYGLYKSGEIYELPGAYIGLYKQYGWCGQIGLMYPPVYSDGAGYYEVNKSYEWFFDPYADYHGIIVSKDGFYNGLTLFHHVMGTVDVVDVTCKEE